MVRKWKETASISLPLHQDPPFPRGGKLSGSKYFAADYIWTLLFPPLNVEANMWPALSKCKSNKRKSCIVIVIVNVLFEMRQLALSLS